MKVVPHHQPSEVPPAWSQQLPPETANALVAGSHTLFRLHTYPVGQSPMSWHLVLQGLPSGAQHLLLMHCAPA